MTGNVASREEKVADLGERVAALEENSRGFARTADKIDIMSEDLHGIKATLTTIANRLDDGARIFERVSAETRDHDKRLFVTETKVEALHAAIFGDGRGKAGLLADMSAAKLEKAHDDGVIGAAAWVAKYGWHVIWAGIAGGASWVLAHLNLGPIIK